MDKITLIQTKLKAPKSQYNEFGGFAYRSCEQILALLKPLLEETGCHLILKDAIDLIGDRYYVRAEAYLYDGEKLIGFSQAFAREPLNRKKMDDAQVTASSSSFARKYALGGLLLIDDTKDPDTLTPEDNTKSDEQRQLEIEERIGLMKKTNLLNARKFQGDLQQKMIATINDPKFNSINGQETLAKRIKAQLEEQIKNLPPAPPKPSVRNAHFSIPPEKIEDKKEPKEEKKPEDYF